MKAKKAKQRLFWLSEENLLRINLHLYAFRQTLLSIEPLPEPQNVFFTVLLSLIIYRRYIPRYKFWKP